MSLASVRSPSPPCRSTAHRLFLRVCTSNPFYVISAGLFLAGLYASFSSTGGDDEAWALMSGLGAYTLLLGFTALLLVRFARAWDDLRTVLLLVVLMFLATSVTFDEVLVLDPERGVLYYLVGLVFAVLVSEGILHGIRLRMPAMFRVPYYLILALFFLYPLCVSLFEPTVGVPQILGGPLDGRLAWSLFAFSPIAGLVFLTLLPAIRCGAAYVRSNGSPWPWPLYPWMMFGLLAFAVPARSFLLCFSMHLFDNHDHGQMIFGPYFIVPFALCGAVLLLELGIVARSRRVECLALAAPLALAILATICHRDDERYLEFLQMFTAQLGATPLFLTLAASACFFLYAAIRRVPLALGHLTATLLVLTIVDPSTLELHGLVGPRPLPLLVASLLQLTIGLVRRNAWHSALGAAGLAVVATLTLPVDPELPAWRGASLFHLVVLAVLIVGTVYEDAAGLLLRRAAIGLLFLAAIVVAAVGLGMPANVPWWVVIYPAAVALVLGIYGRMLHHRIFELLAGAAGACWLAAAGWRSYLALRPTVVGLDRMALGVGVFLLAVLISLGKSGILWRWRHALIAYFWPGAVSTRSRFTT
jgi:hypothetical protein